MSFLGPFLKPQIVEIRPEGDRFLRLLEILGEWYEQGKIIIFVQSQVGWVFMCPFLLLFLFFVLIL